MAPHGWPHGILPHRIRATRPHRIRPEFHGRPASSPGSSPARLSGRAGARRGGRVSAARPGDARAGVEGSGPSPEGSRRRWRTVAGNRRRGKLGRERKRGGFRREEVHLDVWKLGNVSMRLGKGRRGGLVGGRWSSTPEPGKRSRGAVVREASGSSELGTDFLANSRSCRRSSTRGGATDSTARRRGRQRRRRWRASARTRVGARGKGEAELGARGDGFIPLLHLLPAADHRRVVAEWLAGRRRTAPAWASGGRW